MEKLIEIFNAFKNRIRSPFFGSFILAWVAFNWKPLSYFIFSKDKVSYKIDIIEVNYENIYNVLILPLCFSLIYVVIIPYINWGIDELIKRAKKNRKKIQFTAQEDQLKGSIRLAEREKELEDTRSGNVEKSQLNNRIKQLTINIEEKDKIIANYEKQLNDATTENQKLQKQIIEKRKKPIPPGNDF